MMAKARVAVLALALAFSTLALPVMAQDLQRGLRNYQEIMSGRKTLDQLTTQERNEVLQVHRKLQARGGSNGTNAACEDARSRARSTASDLANYSRRLRSCAENEDFADDCSSEFRRVKNAHSDYESAVSEVSGSCN